MPAAHHARPTRASLSTAPTSPATNAMCSPLIANTCNVPDLKNASLQPSSSPPRHPSTIARINRAASASGNPRDNAA